ncbi:efflux RND transporter periplasmic adaptor subunit [Natronospira bacteriovora]|uniref:Efflux RND transporter periplasmic adaptor subunit n=1 Tax=Natronospira bacteriovora TaxID=3069753 RepID=A0ABU0W8T4_9GAMM|nr:efflux RND transporter periplasmic adaptor subunit [Natronospira sp. AB-CW4]MDQ2070328.1 efflux RND transporter periplasmic adaptor subunit [Natronospira sp. AB-CW4]
MQGMGWKGSGLLTTGLLAVGAILVTAWGGAADEEDITAREARPAVRAATVRPAPEVDWQRFPGVLQARERSQAAFLHPGTLAERHVAEGDAIERGQLLATLHNPALAPAAAAAQGRVEELNAVIREHRLALERARALRERDLTSEEEVDRLQARLDASLESRKQAEAQLAEAREQLAELQLRAPFDGWVAGVMAEPGDFLAAGQPVLRLAGREALEVEIRLPATLAGELQNDTPLRLSRPLQGGHFEARLERISRGDRHMATAIIRPESDQDLAAGQVVHVHFGRPHRPSLQVPLTAVIDAGGHQPAVYRLQASDDAVTVEWVPIVPGRLHGDWVDVQQGLSEGDRVVTAGQDRLYDGATVRVLP